jgi:lipopolysaccharide export LptBFGC system permease protein LptF
MSWVSGYRLALRLLPAGLRDKHASAMETLFERELERARERGWPHDTLAGAAGIWDVMRRAAYEQLRSRRGVEGQEERPPLPLPTTAQLLRRHALSFAVAFIALTASLLALFAAKQVPELTARGASAGTISQVVLLAVPFIAALTIPMAVFVAVIREFTRLGSEGALVIARRRREGVRRLVLPVLAAATLVSGLAFVEIAVIVPRANTRLATMTMGRSAAPNSRTMTIGELRDAERHERTRTERLAVRSAAIYEIEIQKKFALSTACLMLAFAGMAIALCFPRGGLGLVVGGSVVVFTTYYLLIITGESLAARLVVSPIIGVWGANVFLVVLALLAMGVSRNSRAPGGSGAVVVDG